MTNQPNNTPTQPTTPNPQHCTCTCTCTPNTHSVTGELGTGKGYTLKTLPTSSPPTTNHHYNRPNNPPSRSTKGNHEQPTHHLQAHVWIESHLKRHDQFSPNVLHGS
ncbi:hypothetical protein [Rhodococcus baikonurensis]|uniref:Uncharacterized protein n=1 Tax=Rhodococcus baikonurensis TaxID=172041 RepID=A0ABV5XSZ8_9NOCA